jgi:hypothetical protein
VFTKPVHLHCVTAAASLVELVDGGRDVWQHQIIYSHHEGHESSITERGGKEREEYMHKGYPPLPIEQGRRKEERGRRRNVYSSWAVTILYSNNLTNSVLEESLSILRHLVQ